MNETFGMTKQSERMFPRNTCCVNVPFIERSASQDKLIKLPPNHTGEIKVKGLLQKMLEEIKSQSQDKVAISWTVT